MRAIVRGSQKGITPGLEFSDGDLTTETCERVPNRTAYPIARITFRERGTAIINREGAV